MATQRSAKGFRTPPGGSATMPKLPPTPKSFRVWTPTIPASDIDHFDLSDETEWPESTPSKRSTKPQGVETSRDTKDVAKQLQKLRDRINFLNRYLEKHLQAPEQIDSPPRKKVKHSERLQDVDDLESKIDKLVAKNDKLESKHLEFDVERMEKDRRYRTLEIQNMKLIETLREHGIKANV